MKIARLSFAFVSLLALSACNSVPVDSTGAIPAEQAGKIDAVSGVYIGTLGIEDHRMGTWTPIRQGFAVTVSRDGNRPVLTVAGDLLRDGCTSVVGKLEALEVGGSWDAIATFAFDPGQCPRLAIGRELLLHVSENGRALLTLEKESRPGRHYHRLSYYADLKKQ